MDCKYCQPIHDADGQIVRHWCLAYWREAACWQEAALYDACPHRQPFAELDYVGTMALITAVVEAAVDAALKVDPQQWFIAEQWATWGGVAPGTVLAARELRRRE